MTADSMDVIPLGPSSRRSMVACSSVNAAQKGATHFSVHPKPCKLLHAPLQDAGPPIGLVRPFFFATFVHWEWLISTCGTCHLATDVLDLTEGAGAHERFAVLWCNVNTAHPRGWLVNLHWVIGDIVICGFGIGSPRAGVIHWVVICIIACSELDSLGCRWWGCFRACPSAGLEIALGAGPKHLSILRDANQKLGWDAFWTQNTIHFCATKDDTSFNCLPHCNFDFYWTLCSQSRSVPICAYAVLRHVGVGTAAVDWVTAAWDQAVLCDALPAASHRAMECNIRDLSHGTNGHACEGGFSLGGDLVWAIHHGWIGIKAPGGLQGSFGMTLDCTNFHRIIRHA